MKLITAVVEPAQLESVKKALNIFGITGLTITEVFRRDLANQHTQVYRGQCFRVDLLAQVRIDLVVADQDVADLIRVITRVASRPHQPGDIGDIGDIWVTPVEVLARVRTGERGPDAL